VKPGGIEATKNSREVDEKGKVMGGVSQKVPRLRPFVLISAIRE
jgi:hypothetical protein